MADLQGHDDYTVTIKLIPTGLEKFVKNFERSMHAHDGATA